MSIDASYFGNDFNIESRLFLEPEKLAKEVERLKEIGLKIVLTMGSFDMLHIGHCRYLKEAKELGDVLVVGVDTDAKVKARKGESRPVVPGEERYEMLIHTRYVDLLTIKDVSQPKWYLIKLFRPDVLQAVDGTYTDSELEELKEYCGQVVVQPRQAETSTSAKVRLLVMEGMHDVVTHLSEVLPDFLKEALTKIKEKKRL